MDFFVYILYSKSTDSFYKGQTNDIQDRLGRHNAGYVKSTAFGKPWTLLWVIKKNSRKDALALEKKLKNLNRKRIVKFICKYNEYCAGSDALTLMGQWSEC